MKIHLVGAELFRADRRTDTTRLFIRILYIHILYIYFFIVYIQM